MRALARYYARMAAYRTPLGRSVARVLRKRGESRVSAEAWDEMMSGALSPYLQRTASVLTRDGLVSMLLQHDRSLRSVLDLGCGAGSLAEAMKHGGLECFVGTDISRLAIATAAKRREERPARFPADCRFIVADLREFTPPQGLRFDAICFSEVLYYLGEPASAAAQVVRATKWLAPGGVVCVSMKDDPKSHAIFTRLAAGMEWVNGALYQLKSLGPSFRIRVSQERPAFLIGVLRPRAEAPACGLSGLAGSAN